MDDMKTQEEAKKGKVEEPSVGIEEESKGFNFMEMLDNPMVGQLMESGKDLFKKEKPDPNMCEITIKAPSEVVLKLFKVE